ncbi:hypothetical protein [Thioalkalivibrio sp. HK1]|uniref:hypothetical protein n=1 Tax=Thioalkalivibrio sp. HK1 TaxID=1469245 RepID=UPI0004727E62|nr:hypothetical protein [Thioalkalivibrio sp. HK1]
MNNEKNGIDMETEQARQRFIVAVEQAIERTVEQAVTKAFKQIVNPRFDEMDHKMDKLRTDMRIAISESDADRLRGPITISGSEPEHRL